MAEHSESRSNPGKVISVAQLNRAVAQRLSSVFPAVWVSGEISNLTRAASGHCYFSLKDERAQVRAVMFRSRARSTPVELRNGMQVEAFGRVGLYEARGDFQLNVDSIRLAGAGDLHQQFVRLKNQLQAEGLFDVDAKRMLPALPRCIGVVTSLQAAALRDVLTTLGRRAPQIPLIVYPTPVQGDEAPPGIVRALQLASERAECDVLLLVRGGGSIEDLWAFNAEPVARAIRATRIPVVVGVGHESDVTIADFAADLRAPTPTGAATVVAPDRAELQHRVSGLARLLAQAWQVRYRQLEQRVDLAWRLVPSPAGQLRARRQRADQAMQALVRQVRFAHTQRTARVSSAAARLRIPDTRLASARLNHLRQRLVTAMRQRRMHDAQRLKAISGALSLVSPQAVMERGYSVVARADGTVLARAADIHVNDAVDILLADGSASARIDGVRVSAANETDAKKNRDQ